VEQIPITWVYVTQFAGADVFGWAVDFSSEVKFVVYMYFSDRTV